LIQLLATASDAEQRCQQADQEGDKPLIVEGNIFVCNDGGATEVAYGKFSMTTSAIRFEHSCEGPDKWHVIKPTLNRHQADAIARHSKAT
jgi:hypothetical protein